ncbi:MAG: translation initiation factor IF-2 [Lentisphaeria bacterium]
MSERTRVYELARELGYSSKEMLEILAGEGLEVKSHASSIDEEFADLVREHIIAERQQQAGETEAPEEAAEETQAEPEEPEAEEVEEAEEAVTDSRELHLKPPIIVRDLAKALGCKPNELIGELMTMNVFAAINQVIEPEVVKQVCDRRDIEFVPERRERRRKDSAKETAKQTKLEPARKVSTEGIVPRPPVVAFLGHVDHGKTSLLDYIRKTNVVRGEAGGITQHIGASTIKHDDHPITFLDTPGHEAFTAMRARGTNATDLVVIVVAADDGVMPQTLEAISHARAAGVSIIIAMNKIDLPGADKDKVLVGLQQNEIMPEDWGGEVGVVPVSAETGDGVDDLLERIFLEAEMLELKGNPVAPCEALVVEAQLEVGMGATANVLVRDGSLHVGDIMLCGQFYGKARALIDQTGVRVDEVGPSTAVKVMGLSGVPQAGERLMVVENEKEAKAIAEGREAELREGQLQEAQGAKLEDLFAQMSEAGRKKLTLVLKADVQGSIEAIIDNLAKIKSEKIDVDIIHRGVGEVTENDVLLAATSGAIIVGFHVRATTAVNRAAEKQNVEIRLYSIIYELLEDIKDAMRGQLEPEQREQHIGTAEILKIFNISKTGRICGCQVNSGEIRVGAQARVQRDGAVIYTGQIVSLKHFQDSVQQVRSGQECGIRLDNFEDFEVGDELRVFNVEKVAAEL